MAAKRFIVRGYGEDMPIASNETAEGRGLNRPYQSCYVYLLQKDAAGKWYVLFPKKGSASHSNPVQPKEARWVPNREEGFPLDKTLGKETIYLLASSWELPDLESPGPRLEKAVIPLTRSFRTRGITGIGRPKADPTPGVPRDLWDTIRRVEGDGGFLRTVSFIHQ